MLRNILIALVILLVFWLFARRGGPTAGIRFWTVCRRTALPAAALTVYFLWRVASSGPEGADITVILPLFCMSVAMWLLAAAVIWSLGRRL